MKKDVLLFLLFLLLLVPTILSATITMNENFSIGETIVAKVSGNFLTQVAKENVFFYRGHVRVPAEYEVLKIDNDFYIYASISGRSNASYTLSIEDVQYMKGATSTTDSIVQNFSILDKFADFSVTPGVVSTSGSFTITIQNLNEEEITLSISIESDSSTRKIFISDSISQSKQFSLLSGEIKKIDFNLGSGETGFRNIKLNSSNFTFNLPVYVSSSEKVPESEKKISFTPSELDLSIPVKNITKKTIVLSNKNNFELKNISISATDPIISFVNLSVSSIDNMKPNSTVSLDLTFYSQNESVSEGSIKFKSENFTEYFFISLNFLEANSPILNQTLSKQINSTLTCAELNGKKFDTKTEKCSEGYENVKDGWCCYGTVSKVEKSQTGRIVAILLVLLLVGGLVWFYFAKYKKAKKPIDLLKVAKGNQQMTNPKQKPSFFKKKI